MKPAYRGRGRGGDEVMRGLMAAGLAWSRRQGLRAVLTDRERRRRRYEIDYAGKVRVVAKGVGDEEILKRWRVVIR